MIVLVAEPLPQFPGDGQATEPRARGDLRTGPQKAIEHRSHEDGRCDSSGNDLGFIHDDSFYRRAKCGAILSRIKDNEKLGTTDKSNRRSLDYARDDNKKKERGQNARATRSADPFEAQGRRDDNEGKRRQKAQDERDVDKGKRQGKAARLKPAATKSSGQDAGASFVRINKPGLDHR